MRLRLELGFSHPNSLRFPPSPLLALVCPRPRLLAFLPLSSHPPSPTRRSIELLTPLSILVGRVQGSLGKTANRRAQVYSLSQRNIILTCRVRCVVCCSHFESHHSVAFNIIVSNSYFFVQKCFESVHLLCTYPSNATRNPQFIYIPYSSLDTNKGFARQRYQVTSLLSHRFTRSIALPSLDLEYLQIIIQQLRLNGRNI
ncbi:hypothetical protein F4801DRAFT_483828 [Xylaria longipes]|nr:hypothetical protein F4801DRAFT_483828 [Xylaria longipes]